MCVVFVLLLCVLLGQTPRCLNSSGCSVSSTTRFYFFSLADSLARSLFSLPASLSLTRSLGQAVVDDAVKQAKLLDAVEMKLIVERAQQIPNFSPPEVDNLRKVRQAQRRHRQAHGRHTRRTRTAAALGWAGLVNCGCDGCSCDFGCVLYAHV